MKNTLLLLLIFLSIDISAQSYKNIVPQEPVQKHDIRNSSKVNAYGKPDLSKTGEKPTYVKDTLSKNKNVNFDKIVFIKRVPRTPSHYYTTFIDGLKNNTTPEETQLCILNIRTGEVKNLIPDMKEGTVDDFDISFDAKKIVFSYKKRGGELKASYLLYEIDVDGKNLKQLTFPEDEQTKIRKELFGNNMHKAIINDMQPCYLSDGSIMFASTRLRTATLCNAANQLVGTNITKLTTDGKIQILTQSPVSEFNPELMDDGTVIYSRWEYVDKDAGAVKCLWAMRQDGTGTKEIYGNDISEVRTFFSGQKIPNTENKILALGAAHYLSGDAAGSVVVLDISKDIRTTDPIKFITPWTFPANHSGVFYYSPTKKNWFLWTDYGKWQMERIKNNKSIVENVNYGRTNELQFYADPYPLSEDLFLVSHNEGRYCKDSDSFGLYFLDDKGNHELIFRDEKLSAYAPKPLIERAVPPMTNGMIDENLEKENMSLVSIQDVYYGLEGVERGTVKYIRILEQPYKDQDAGNRGKLTSVDKDGMAHKALGYHSLSVKYGLGLVEIQEDGSAKFLVPSNRNIYFQLLDKNYMLIQSERTYINYMPGEVRSCIGCHEKPRDVPPAKPFAIALKKPNSKYIKQPNYESEKMLFDYENQIQPIFDNNCISCHNETNKDNVKNLILTGEDTKLYKKSYESLKPFIFDNWPKETQVNGNIEYTQSYTFGSHTNKVIRQVIKGCPNQKSFMTDNEFLNLVTWIDTGMVYYPSYHGMRNISYKGKASYRPKHTWETATSLYPIDEHRGENSDTANKK